MVVTVVRQFCFLIAFLAVRCPTIMWEYCMHSFNETAVHNVDVLMWVTVLILYTLSNYKRIQVR